MEFELKIDGKDAAGSLEPCLEPMAPLPFTPFEGHVDVEASGGLWEPRFVPTTPLPFTPLMAYVNAVATLEATEAHAKAEE